MALSIEFDRGLRRPADLAELVARRSLRAKMRMRPIGSNGSPRWI